MGGRVRLDSISLTLNYWELSAAELGKRLDQLLKRGIQTITTFIPWQVAEADISHSLNRFLQATSDRQFGVFLILSPELGIHYLYSGLPKDVALKKENRAKDSLQAEIPVILPPNSFYIPSLFAPEFNKRYSSFLTRMDGFFSDLLRNQPSLLRDVSLILTGSYWKYYRGYSGSIFGKGSGEYSTHATIAYRQRMDHFFSQKEFADPIPASSNRWKTRAMEGINRKWFYQQSEEIFKARTHQTLQKRCSRLAMMEVDLSVPEADPSLRYSNLIQMLSSSHADFFQLSKLLEELSARSPMTSQTFLLGGGGFSPSFVHWSAMGGFRMLAEAEKQFLILKSLLLTSAQGGGILMDEGEWDALSSSFKTRVELLSHSFSKSELQAKTKVLYLTPHLWSKPGLFWEDVRNRLGPSARMIASLDLIAKDRSPSLLIIDPSYILVQDSIRKIAAWVKAGRVVLLPKTHLYTESARLELERLLSSHQNVQVDFGVSYSVHSLGEGKLVSYDLPEELAPKEESLGLWKSLLDATLSISEIEPICELSEKRLKMVSFETSQGGLALFVLNGTDECLSADLSFPHEVQISDLGSFFSRGSSPEKSQFTQSLPLEVPPFGVLPLAIEGLKLLDYREKQLAASLSEDTRMSASSSATSELPGLHLDQNFEDLWS